MVADQCYWDGTCDLTNNILAKLMAPLSDLLTFKHDGQYYDFTIMIFWGLIITIIYIRSHSALMASIAGVLVLSALSTPSPLQLPAEAISVGTYLIGVSIAFALFQLIMYRLHERS